PVQPGQVDLPLRVLHDRAGAGVHGQARALVLQVEAARGRQLLGHHEPRARGAHEGQLHGGGPASATSASGVDRPKYRSYRSSTRARVSISAAGLSGRSRTMRGKCSAKPLRCRADSWMASNATSMTVLGSTSRARPGSASVWARKKRVISAISASVRPLYALPTLRSRPLASSRTANV